jgi:hypothetical protein
LSAGNADIPHDISERLRVARMQAVAKRKVVSVTTAGGMSGSGGAAVLHFGGNGNMGWWGRVASTLPLLALAIGLLTIYVVQNEDRTNELAEVDAALLTDDLPTAAFTDPGFAQFLKTSTDSAPSQ